MFFDYCGSKIYFEDLNPKKENAKTIVFLHGWGSDSRVFFSVAKHLSQNFRCVLVDFLGFGKSDIPKISLSIENQTEAVLSLCNFLEIKKFHILSHSYGGRISINLLAKENSRVISALLIAPAGVKDKNLKKSANVAIFKIRKKLTSKKNIKKLEKFYSKDYQNASGVMKETFMKAVNFNQVFQLSNIKSKVLIVRGNEDTAVTKRMVKTMQKRMENCKLVEIQGDHFAFLQNAVQFQIIAENFFEN